MTLAAELRARALAAVAILDKLARADLADDAPDEGSTVAEARTKAADDFAAALLLLWERLQREQIDADGYTAQVEALFDRAVGTVPEAGQATIDRLKQQALNRAQAFIEKVDIDPDREDAPSEPQKKNFANMVAGAVWGAIQAAGALREEKETVSWATEEDNRVCDPCDALDGKTWDIDKVPFWPGDDDAPCEGQGLCRCSLD